MKQLPRILIGGSNGYIGTKLCEFLKKKNYDFETFDINLFAKCLLYPIKKKYKSSFKDVRDIDDDYLKKFDVYIHLPGISNNPVDNFKNKKKIYDITREYTKKIALKCKRNNVKFIFASSCSVYGEGKKKNLTENSKCNPITHYSKNKLEIEKDLKLISDKNFNPIILRISTLFGFSPRMRFDLALPMFLVMAKLNKKIQLNSDGESWRPHLYLDDLISIFEKCFFIKNKKLIVINVGSNQNNFKIIDVAKLISKLTKSKLNFLNNENKNLLIKDKTVNYGKDKRNYSVSFQKIEKIFPSFKFTSVKNGLIKDIKILRKLKISKNVLSDKKYFRLFYLSHLIKNKKIDKNLRVIKL
jgi:nucleoside-diphosphate-sugar epimerase|tara:strand:- start:388 stop:1455 length:1068 start_codon:yes stop_codon:yes gene_type:complete